LDVLNAKYAGEIQKD
jgi:hypothetical protein